MRAALAIVCILVGASQAQAQDAPRPKVDRKLLERFLKLSPQEKARLKERLRILQSLSPEERQRLRENLRRLRELPPPARQKIRERFERLSPEERKALQEVASGFFRWLLTRFGEAEFPRHMFFRWLQRERQDRVRELLELDESRRKEEFLREAYNFRGHWLLQLEVHARRHGCVGAAELRALRKAPFAQFWPQAMRLFKKCSGERPQGPARAPGPR